MNFKVDDVVYFNTVAGSAFIGKKAGTILSMNDSSFLIVLLPKPDQYGNKAQLIHKSVLEIKHG